MACVDCSGPCAGAAGGEGHDDARILRELFDGTGIMGALDHNKIEVRAGSGPPLACTLCSSMDGDRPVLCCRLTAA